MKVGEPGNGLRIRVFQVKTKNNGGWHFRFLKDFSDFFSIFIFSVFLTNVTAFTKEIP